MAPPVFWMVNVVNVVPPGSDCGSDIDRCEVDAIDFVFRQSKGSRERCCLKRLRGGIDGETNKGGGGVGWTCGGA